MKGEIHALFPIPVYKEKLRLPSNQELDYFKSLNLCGQTLGNLSSIDNYVLNHPALSSLKQEIEITIQDYCNNILHANVDIYITNSWLNETNSKQQHFLHNHSNSILSGVYYIDVEDSLPLITFNRMQLPFLLNFVPKEFTMFNSTEWSVPVENGSIIIFPSTLYHYVKPNDSNNSRHSLAFNTFVKGNIGFSKGSELIL